MKFDSKITTAWHRSRSEWFIGVQIGCGKIECCFTTLFRNLEPRSQMPSEFFSINQKMFAMNCFSCEIFLFCGLLHPPSRGCVNSFNSMINLKRGRLKVKLKGSKGGSQGQIQSSTPKLENKSSPDVIDTSATRRKKMGSLCASNDKDYRNQAAETLCGVNNQHSIVDTGRSVIEKCLENQPPPTPQLTPRKSENNKKIIERREWKSFRG